MIKRLIQQLKDWWKFQMLTWETERNVRNFKRSCELADKMCKGDGKTRYVIKGSSGWQIFSTDDLDYMKRSKQLRSNVTILEILTKSHYVASSNKQLTEFWEKEKRKQLKK